jgi:tRNA-2-methylthio-N6-dimethylallyladenosine synthase
MAKSKHICRQLHLPLQSGSDAVLKDMNRRYNREKYLQIVDKARSLMPDIAITTDIIVGFPTETREDFEATLDMLKRVRYDSIFSFIYSRRNGTPAAKMEQSASDEEIKGWFEEMLAVQNDISYEINSKAVGEEQYVLAESVSKNEKGVITARNEANKIVNVKGDESLIGKMFKVKITRAQTWVLFGEII